MWGCRVEWDTNNFAHARAISQRALQGAIDPALRATDGRWKLPLPHEHHCVTGLTGRGHLRGENRAPVNFFRDEYKSKNVHLYDRCSKPREFSRLLKILEHN